MEIPAVVNYTIENTWQRMLIFIDCKRAAHMFEEENRNPL